MPIVVVCSGCGAKLSAPDAAAGKRVKCPKPGCGVAINVPAPAAPSQAEDQKRPAPPPVPKPKQAAFDLDDEDEPRKPAKKPPRAADDYEDERPARRRREEDDERPTRRRRDEDDDERPARRRRDERDEDDEYEDDRPTRRRKQKGGGLSPALIAVIAIVGLLVLGGAGYGIYALATKKKDDTAGDTPPPPPAPKKAVLPAGWQEYKSDSDKFKIFVPKPMVMEKAGQAQRRYESKDEPRTMVAVLVQDIPPDNPGLDMRQLTETAIIHQFKNTPMYKNVSERKLDYLGQSITEVTVDAEEPGKAGKGEKLRMSVRVVQFEKKIYMVMVGLGEANTVPAETVFDSFEPIK